MKKRHLPLLCVLFFSCTTKQPQVAIYTSEGIIKVKIFSKKAPNTANNFLMYVTGKYYDNTSFYRTVTNNNQPNNKVKIEVIQGGISFEGERNIYPPIKHESTQLTNIKHLDGTISMARAEIGTVTSEFFICINNQPELDYGGTRNPDLQGFAAFGQVTKGLDVVKKIQLLPEKNQFITKKVRIDSIRQIK